MKKLTPEARALAQALLDHHKQFSSLESGQKRNLDSCLIAYGDLCERAGVPHLNPTVGTFLREIAEWWHDNGWPPLNSLAINYGTRKPGRGYDGAPGCSLQKWRQEVESCINFNRYPATVS